MKKVAKISIIIAAAMILIGIALMCIAFVLGANPWQAVEDGLLSINGSTIVTGEYKELDNDYRTDNHYTQSAQGIGSLDIQWTSGSVDLVIGNGPEIQIYEESGVALDEKTALRYGVQDGVLYIQYCGKESLHLNLPDKHLTVELPEALATGLESVRVESASADLTAESLTVSKFIADTSSGDLYVQELKADSIKLNTVSGNVDFSGDYTNLYAGSSSGELTVQSNGMPRETKIESVSGDVHVYGTFGELEIDASSGNVISGETTAAREISVETVSGEIRVAGSFDNAELSSSSGEIEFISDVCPRELDVETTSGSVSLAIPEDSEFRLEYDTVSGDLDCDFSVKFRDDEYICGNGASEFSVETTSGNLYVKQK